MKRSFLRALFLAGLTFVVPAWAASDPDDASEVKDHPEIPRYPGYWLSGDAMTDFNSHEFHTSASKTQTVEGEYWSLRYALKEGAKRPSMLAILRNYENAIQKAGGKLLVKDLDGRAYRVFQQPLGKRERWVEIEVFDEANSYLLTIVDTAPMEQVLELSAGEMKQQLDKDGFVSLYGITFDTGKDVIKPESEPILKEIVSLMKANGSLKLSVEGHTDNVGNAKSNQTLSQKRAAAVQKWLTGKGIAAGRLSSKGHGHTIPVADNRIESGREKNRRVELVKQ